MANVVAQLDERLVVPVAIIILPTIDGFSASKNFVMDASSQARVKISYMGDNFRRNFLSKVEKGLIQAEVLAVNKIHITSETDPATTAAIIRGRDADLVSVLGGEARVEISLGQLFMAVAKQPNCENGALQTNGCITIGYVRNIFGILMPVDVGRLNGGWAIGSGYRDNPDFYHEGGCQYISR